MFADEGSVARMLLGSVEKNFSKDVTKVVDQHAAACGVAASMSLTPFVGPVACVIAQSAIVYTMFVRMNNVMGIQMSKEIVQDTATTVVSSIANNAKTYVLSVTGATMISGIPIVGGFAASFIMAGIGYAITCISAKSYGRALQNLTGTGKNIAGMSRNEVMSAVNATLCGCNITADMKYFSNIYKQGRKNGTYTGKEKVTLLD